jgi:response regulator of citrate/malate metabolism
VRALEILEELRRELATELASVNAAIAALQPKGKGAGYFAHSMRPATLSKVEDAVERAGTPLYASELAAAAKVSKTTAERAGRLSPDIVVTKNGRRYVYDWRERVELQRAEALAVNGD